MFFLSVLELGPVHLYARLVPTPKLADSEKALSMYSTCFQRFTNIQFLLMNFGPKFNCVRSSDKVLSDPDVPSAPISEWNRRDLNAMPKQGIGGGALCNLIQREEFFGRSRILYTPYEPVRNYQDNKE